MEIGGNVVFFQNGSSGANEDIFEYPSKPSESLRRRKDSWVVPLTIARGTARNTIVDSRIRVCDE